MNSNSMLKKTGLVAAAALLAVSGAASAYIAVGGGPCNVGANGQPVPPNCTYRTPQQIHAQGLQNQINLSASHGGFANVTTQTGGIYHGEVERFDSTLTFHIEGINELQGVTATVTVPAHCETHIGPRDAKADFQRFDTMMYDLQGVASDANFESVKIVAGMGNGLPSPGSTTLTRNREGGYLVNSSFQMNYRIELVGRAGGKFDGVLISEEGVATVTAYANETTAAK
jgi:hypothetical protein